MKQISKGTPEQLLHLVEDRIEELLGRLDSATNTCGMDINPDVSDDEVESSFIYPEDLEALEDGDYESHVTEPIESSVSWDDAEAYDDDVSAILDFLANKGYDADSKIVKDYAHTVAKQFDAYRKSWHETGEAFSYGLSDWYQDTRENYPDELEELPRIDACDTIQSSRWDDWSPEDFEGGYTEWDEVASKSVKDSDGFWTDYTMWYNEFKDEYVFTFGDKDIYYPENADIDWECENEDEAWEWFDNYKGLEDDDDEDIYSSEEIHEVLDATDVVRFMYNKFPQYDFIDERDLGERGIALYFECRDTHTEELKFWLDKYMVDYVISNGRLRIIAPEAEDYKIEECDSVESSEEFFDKGDDQIYWYLTTHGVQPGSVPKGLDIFEVIDKPEGSYFSTNRVLTTDALKYYDIKEKAPQDIKSSSEIGYGG